MKNAYFDCSTERKEVNVCCLPLTHGMSPIDFRNDLSSVTDVGAVRKSRGVDERKVNLRVLVNQGLKPHGLSTGRDEQPVISQSFTENVPKYS